MKKTIHVDYKLLNSKGQFSLENKLDELLASGVDEILVKPVLMSDGYETKKMRELLSPYENRFCKIEVGIPVLGNKPAIDFFAGLLIRELGFMSEFEYCLVGHGLSESANVEYASLSDEIHSKGYFNVEVACLAGEGNVDSYLCKIKEKARKSAGGKLKPIMVYPLLINPGTHISHDIFGADESEEKSFVQRLEENGFTVVKNPVPLSQFEFFKEFYLDEKI